MKRLVFWIPVLLSLFMLAGCGDDDFSPQVPESVKEKLLEKYPDATGIVWSISNGWYVADFENGSIPTREWFSYDGIWTMSDEKIPYQALPEAVQLAYEESEFATPVWTMADIERITRREMESRYLIEVEREMEQWELLYSEEGILVRAEQDLEERDDHEDLLPTPPTPPATE